MKRLSFRFTFFNSLCCHWPCVDGNIFFNPYELVGHESNTTNMFIQNKQVLVKWQQKPAYIYYVWLPFSIGNLQNSEQLPASTFKLKVE